MPSWPGSGGNAMSLTRKELLEATAGGTTFNGRSLYMGRSQILRSCNLAISKGYELSRLGLKFRCNLRISKGLEGDFTLHGHFMPFGRHFSEFFPGISLQARLREEGGVAADAEATHLVVALGAPRRVESFSQIFTINEYQIIYI